ncbi:MAG: queuosine precursor transporter [Verrucomicrobia bacterium]|nr:queuosine precursor transporter [Verrucomicrobiota bacterium]
MNESLFLLHVVLVMGFGFGALRMGKAALSAWVALQAVLANLFVIKQICFFGFHVTCSDVFAIGSIFGLNLLREYYGKEAAKKALWSCFFAMVFFVAMAQIHLLYTPSPLDTTHPAFDSILSSSPRLLIASLAVFFIVQQIDLRLFGWIKEKCNRVPLALRNAGSLVATQFLDTVLFSFLGLWGLVASLFDIILVSFLIKLAVIALMTPLIQFSKRFAPHDSYDRV